MTSAPFIPFSSSLFLQYEHTDSLVINWSRNNINKLNRTSRVVNVHIQQRKSPNAYNTLIFLLLKCNWKSSIHFVCMIFFLFLSHNNLHNNHICSYKQHFSSINDIKAKFKDWSWFFLSSFIHSLRLHLM